MKKRSEITGVRKRSEAVTRSSAAERTEPLPTADARHECGSCEHGFVTSEGTRRDDGTLECPECGAPASALGSPAPKTTSAPSPTLKRSEGAPRAQQSASSEGRREPSGVTVKGHELPKVYCDECGTEWPRTADGKPFPNCGHQNGFVYDPARSKRYAPPAGHPRLSPPELEAKRAAIEKQLEEGDIPEELEAPRVRLPARAGKPPADPKKPPQNPATIVSNHAAQPTTTIQQNRIHVGWGKACFPVIPGQYGSFNTPDLDVWLELAEGANIVDTARAILPELERVASEVFDRQLSWYLERLDLISDKVSK